MTQNAPTQYISAGKLEKLASGATVLRKALKLHTVITTSPLTTQNGSSHPQSAREIGRGLQGIIFEKPGESLVVKKRLPEMIPITGKDLTAEFAMHQSVFNEFLLWNPRPHRNINVPCPARLILPEEDEAYHAILEEWGLPQERSKTPLGLMDRILPLPEVLRHALVTYFFPPNRFGYTTTDAMEDDPSNEHYLVRPYLGTRTHTVEDFSLRNLVLALDNLQQLEVGVKDLAISMGMAYANMHWGAHVDACNVEFVIGSSLMLHQSLQQHKIGLFLLDFGHGTEVDMNGYVPSVYQAFITGMCTGAGACHIPHYRHSPELFEKFGNAYKVTAKTVMHRHGLNKRFDIEEFVREYKNHLWKPCQ